jgi:hypothetical protein
VPYPGTAPQAFGHPTLPAPPPAAAGHAVLYGHPFQQHPQQRYVQGLPVRQTPTAKYNPCSPLRDTRKERHFHPTSHPCSVVLPSLPQSQPQHNQRCQHMAAGGAPLTAAQMAMLQSPQLVQAQAHHSPAAAAAAASPGSPIKYGRGAVLCCYFVLLLCCALLCRASPPSTESLLTLSFSCACHSIPLQGWTREHRGSSPSRRHKDGLSRK